MEPGSVPIRNSCFESKSPYVRSHADNPTAWQLWTPQTLDLARQTNRLLLVSIGYSACHWCHVMAHESFDDPQVAQLLNDNFIPIKIDREERPDIDRQYMEFVQATTGGGGWPLNVFVTPDLEPVFGGTYWPKEAFGKILQAISKAWHEREDEVRESGKQVVQQLREFAAKEGQGSGGQSSSVGLDVLRKSFQHYNATFDNDFGGFGGAPKFPTPAHIWYLLQLGSYPSQVREAVREDNCLTARNMALKTLECMAKGGIKDQIGHGFARYSVTRDWSLPHFEKMLYDNAQLLPVYVDAYLVTNSRLFLETAHDIATYLTTEPMAASSGGIHASEDADSLPTATSDYKLEGAFYVWTLSEFKQILSEQEAQICAAYWNVQSGGNVERQYDAHNELRGQNTLCVVRDPEDLATEHGLTKEETTRILHEGREKLLAYRNHHRPRPALDDKVVTAWNGLAIGALAQAGSALQTPSYLSAAKRAVECISEHLFDSNAKTLKRVFREGPGETPGFADDYAFLISGLIDLYEATFNDEWLSFADTLQKTQVELFWDGEGHGFFSTPANQADILVRSKDTIDNAEPSINGVSADNLFRLASLLDDENYERRARQIVTAFHGDIATHPSLFSRLLRSVVASQEGTKSIMVVGNDAAADAVVRRFRESVTPGWTILRVGGQSESEWLRGRNGLLKDLDPEREMVQLCEGGTCRLLSSKEVEQLFA